MRLEILKDLCMNDIKRHLRGPKHNIGEMLFQPSFKDCKLYRRQTAFFQPSVFKCWADSLEEIIKNETKIEILMAFSESNSRILRLIRDLQTKKEKDSLINKEANSLFLQCLGLAANSEDFHKRNRLIRYLYAKELLEIKLSVSYQPDTEELSLSHEKTGYFINNDKTIILFNGSMNESESALLRNGEHITVYQSQKTKDNEDIDYFKSDLDAKWNNEDEYSKIFNPTRRLIDQIKENSDIGSKADALDVAREIIEEEKSSGLNYFKLREHQKRAIKAWDASNRVGILDHATGSGKTYTAVRMIQALRHERTQLSVVIGVPYILLADQWEEVLNEHFMKIKGKEGKSFEFNQVICCHSDVESSLAPQKNRITKESLNLKDSVINKKGHLSIYIVVNATLFSEEFRDIFFDKNIINPNKLLFIGDECHRYASTKSVSFLNPDAKFRLGLSATAFDDEAKKTSGETAMEDYFGGICDKYSLKDGIKDKHLCNYYYYPIKCYLEESEYLEWQNYLDSYKPKDNEEDSDAFKAMENIVDKSKNKYREFESLIKDDITFLNQKTGVLKDKKGTLVFCGQAKIKEERPIDYVSSQLDRQGWRYHRITATESKSDRKNAINGFVRGDIGALTAIRVLDEGVDIPSIKRAIILASSNKRRQFIQRRGRVLRASEEEDKIAEIYDFIVLPPANFSERGRQLIDREMARCQEMGQDSLNSKDVKLFIQEFRGLYDAV